MKMYFKNLIFALAGALAMTACSNEMEQQLAEGSGNSGQEVKFTVGIENFHCRRRRGFKNHICK